MKLQRTFIIGMAVLFSACTPREDISVTETASESVTGTLPETREVIESKAEPEAMPAMLSERDISGYAVSGSVLDDENCARTVYSAFITGGTDISAVGEFIARIEAMPFCYTSEFYDTFNSSSASLTLEKDGERYTYTEKSYNENGVKFCCILRRGIYDRDTFCVRFEDKGDNSLHSLMGRLIAKEENVSEREKYPEKSDGADIVLIREYKNWAWGYQHSGSFVDMNGNVYDFDFSTDTYGGEEIGSDAELMNRLTEICSEDEPVSDAAVGHTDILRQIRELADGADRNARLISRPDCYDAGQSTVYAVTSENRLVTVCSDGDNAVTSTDGNAYKIQRLWEEMINAKE
ncbi:MAG: hypothetical protein SOT68_02350 [Oscillospiraceae bacterium]|nr:hypothetical protein [Oscillospiraceae bacterium]MCI7499087.1 hypothetical protein [Oscillospiraceae bacterium]MDD7279770.1 hypothetical protein [Oscillospiraceae bacterium]MDY2863016.1 hypothetical protein [Oscillospiraceae bacterium]